MRIALNSLLVVRIVFSVRSLGSKVSLHHFFSPISIVDGGGGRRGKWAGKGREANFIMGNLLGSYVEAGPTFWAVMSF